MKPKSICAVVLAGTHRDPKRLIRGRNKVLLPLREKPLVAYSIDALLEAPSIDRIVVVGPLPELQSCLKPYPARVKLVPEGDSLVANAWRGFCEIVAPGLSDHSEELASGAVGPSLHLMEKCEAADEVLAEIALILNQPAVSSISIQQMQIIVDRHHRRHFLFEGRSRYNPAADLPERILHHEALHIEQGQVRFASPELQAAYSRLGTWLQTHILYVTGDIPLISPDAIEDFIARCEKRDRDFYFGVTNELALEPYYPGADSTGIRRPYVHLREARVRLLNLNLVRPKMIAKAWLIKQGFELRKMIPWRNVLRLARLLLGLRGRAKALYLLSACQTAAVLARHDFQKAALFFARACPVYEGEKLFSSILGTDFQIVMSPFGGLAIDVDTEEDFSIIQEHYPEWMAFQQEVACSIGAAAAGPPISEVTPAGRLQ